ncbi:GTPase HflX [bacterium]|nr:GTPase HflX [bacterium]
MSAERVFLVSVNYRGGLGEVASSLSELERLTWTAGGEVVGVKKFSRRCPDAALFLGSGQVQELKNLAARQACDLLIVDHELRPIQQRNLEEALALRVIDRTQLILDIFARRAKTHEGKIQVELAQLSYLLPRLTGKGVLLSRLGGGIGTRGPGESKLEYDRRRLRSRIAVLKQKLETLKRTRRLHRRDRESVPLPLVSLVGYTNAGKSALLTALTGNRTFIEDKLFATLDLTTRKLVLPPAQEVLLTDTVGFIRNLPHHLVAAFRGTMEEVVAADLLLHVIDCAHQSWENQSRTVNQVLKELGAGSKLCLTVFNKIDKIGQAARCRLGYQFPEAIQISALTGEGLDKLVPMVKQQLSGGWKKIILRLPYEQSHLRALILKRGRLIKESYGQKIITLQVELPPKIIGQIQQQRKYGRNANWH